LLAALLFLDFPRWSETDATCSDKQMTFI
jgi:hypothetical protein